MALVHHHNLHRVFVYGTLLRGECNHGLLVRSRSIGTASTEPRYELVDLGGYPGMVADGHNAVHGEVYEVDDATLTRLDALEGHPEFYRRTSVRLGDGREVQTYLLPAHEAHGCPRLAAGDWRRYRQGRGAREAGEG